MSYIKRQLDSQEIQNHFLCEAWGVSPRIIAHTDTSLEIEMYDMTYDEYCSQNREGDLTELDKRVNDLLAIMHSHGYIHGDLHGGNIVLKVDDAGKVTDVKLIDFSHMTQIDDSSICQIYACKNIHTVDDIYRYEISSWKLDPFSC